MEISRQEYWSGLPFPLPGNHPEPGIEPASPALAGGFFITEPPGNPTICSEILLATRPIESATSPHFHLFLRPLPVPIMLI